jgi:hypothetical protein
MKKNEIVWRTLSDAALNGRRGWSGLSAVADVAGVPRSTVHQAIGRLVDAGIARQENGGGITVIQAEKLIDLIAAHRNLSGDVLARTTLDAAQALIELQPARFYVGGPNAAIHYLGGRNTVATPGTRILYTPEPLDEELPRGDDVVIVRIDRNAAEHWTDGYASPTQTYADLWNTPGWQAAEFTRAMKDSMFPAQEWDQRVGV